MILERLQLTNFRCYAGTTEIVFAKSGPQNTTIIEGTNGAGKTSILHALNFALYGRSAVTTDSPLIHHDVLKLGRESQPAQGGVLLEFSDKGTAYRLSRTVAGYLQDGRFLFSNAQDEVLLTYVSERGLTEKEPHPAQRIESMLPRPIRTFFLFDGDRIADFTRPGRERDDTISRAVNDVLHIEPLSRAVDHTAKIAAEKRKILEQAAPPSVDQTKTEIRLQEATVKTLRERLKQIADEMRLLDDRRSAIDERLSTIVEVAMLAVSRRDLENARSGAIERGLQLRRQLARAVVLGVPALVGSRLDAAAALLSKHKAQHEIPARIADHFLRDLLERGNCICTRPIDDGSGAREHLAELLASLLPNSLQDLATELMGRLRPFRADIQPAIKRIVELLSEIAKNTEDISKIDREIERLGGEIDASAIESSQTLNRQRAEMSRQIEKLKGDEARSERDADIGEKKLRLLEQRFKDETAKRAGLAELNTVWTLARECADAFRRGKTLLEDRLRANLTVEATDIMKKLASDDKKYFFSEIRVDPGFILRVLDGDGRDVRSQLSMGETQVSSLSFMLAMTRLGGQEAPLVVDTPLARLDKSVRVNTANWLPELTPQLILLVTDAEYESSVEEKLGARVGRRYQLVPGPGGTRIEEVAYA